MSLYSEMTFLRDIVLQVSKMLFPDRKFAHQMSIFLSARHNDNLRKRARKGGGGFFEFL